MERTTKLNQTTLMGSKKLLGTEKRIEYIACFFIEKVMPEKHKNIQKFTKVVFC